MRPVQQQYVGLLAAEHVAYRPGGIAGHGKEDSARSGEALGDPPGELGDGVEGYGCLLPFGFENEPSVIDGEGHIDFADRPDVSLNATETPAPEQFGNEFVEPLASLLYRHLFQAAHAPVVGDQLAKAQGGWDVEVVAVHGDCSRVESAATWCRDRSRISTCRILPREGSVMPGEVAHGAKSTPPLRTLADRVNWLISTAHPAGRGPYSSAEVAALIRKITGERVSHTTIWKLRNGQATNPQKRLIEPMARTSGVRPAFLFGDHDVNQADLVQEEVEMLAMICDARITADQLRPFLRLSPEARQLIIGFVTVVARDEARRRAGQGEDA